MQPRKKLLLKLGTQCNLGCSHCHQTQKTFKEHPRLLDWIEEQRFDTITFSGGEPLLYFDLIKKIMMKVGKNPTYIIVSNGTLITKEIINFLTEYRFLFFVSYDGKTGSRDLSLPIPWGTIKQFPNWGISSVFSSPNFSYKDFYKDLLKIFREHQISKDPGLIKVNWIHQTKEAPNKEFTKKEADSYIEQSLKQLEKAIFSYSQNIMSRESFISFLRDSGRPNEFKHGVFCCNENLLHVNLDGTVMKCAYGTEIIGTIDNLPSKEFLDSLVPIKCKSCKYWKYCKCSCIASITDLQCYIANTKIPRIKELFLKYHIQEELDSFFE